MRRSSTLMAEDISRALARGRDVSVASHGTRSKWRVMSHSSCRVKGNCNPFSLRVSGASVSAQPDLWGLSYMS